jgi:hypothetical protein
MEATIGIAMTQFIESINTCRHPTNLFFPICIQNKYGLGGNGIFFPLPQPTASSATDYEKHLSSIMYYLIFASY